METLEQFFINHPLMVQVEIFTKDGKYIPMEFTSVMNMLPIPYRGLEAQSLMLMALEQKDGKVEYTKVGWNAIRNLSVDKVEKRSVGCFRIQTGAILEHEISGRKSVLEKLVKAATYLEAKAINPVKTPSRHNMDR